MPVHHRHHYARAATLSRRRLLSTLVATASAAALAPVLGGPGPASAQTPFATPGAMMPNTLAPDASERFRAVADSLMAAMTTTGTPGGALGILADGVEEHAAFGLTSIDGGDPVTLDTLFQIGSITKTHTGTAVMRLMDDGALDLDATVRTYLPDFTLAEDDVAARVTVRHLLTHTGGWWGDLFVDTGSSDDAIEQYVARWFPTFPQLSPLGEYVSYNNAGFTLLGRLIEVVTGQTYGDAMRDLVLDPLALTGSLFAPDKVLARPHAQGHFTANGETRIQEPLFLPRSTDPAGGLWSTTPELLRYARFHLGDGTADGARVLSPAAMTQMQTTQEPIPGQPGSSIGLPWFIIEAPGLRLITHDGGTFGQQAALWLAPDRGFAVTWLLNAFPGAVVEAQAILIEAFSQYLGIGPGAAQMATPVASPPPVPIAPPDDLQQYAGRYEDPAATYELQVEDEALILTYELHPLPEQVRPALIPDLPLRIPVEFIAPDLALVTIEGLPLPLGFVRRDDGSIGWASASLRLVPKVDPA